MKSIHLHLVSDSSGETVSSIARACLVQFEDVNVNQHLWWLVRTSGQAKRVLEGLRRQPGLVLYTVVDADIRRRLEEGFREIEVPHIPALDPVLNMLSAELQAQAGAQPGRQHVMDAEYYRRIDAMNFTIEHDDGQSIGRIEEADVVIFGVSRTSKTPTSMYLANRGLKVVNIPVVFGIPIPQQALNAVGPLKVGLTREPRSLADIRRNRLRLIQAGQSWGSDYADEDQVRQEVTEARRIFTRLGFPIIDVTRRSIEEAAATILQLHLDHRHRREGIEGYEI